MHQKNIIFLHISEINKFMIPKIINLFQIWNSINDFTYIEKSTNNLVYKVLLRLQN